MKRNNTLHQTKDTLDGKKSGTLLKENYKWQSNTNHGLNKNG